MTIVDSPFDILEEHGKHLFDASGVGVVPMFNVAPEALDAVDLGSFPGSAFLVGHHDICPAQTKAGVSLILIGVIQAADGGVGVDNGQQFSFTPRRDWNGPDIPIPLLDAEYNGFSFGTPTPGAVLSSKNALIDITKPVYIVQV